MDIQVASKHLIAQISTSLDVDGREHLVIVIKGTWLIPEAGQRPRPIASSPLLPSDKFVGDPGQSAMICGDDFARYKPRCDVLFDSCAHAPDGKEVQELTVACQVGPMKKGIKVVGPRQWRKLLGMYTLTKTMPFTSMPLHYGHAFGGTRTYEKGWGDKPQILTETMLSNPAGIGWGGKRTGGDLDGEPAPNLHALDDNISSPTGNYKPVALSAVARHWTPRTQYTGTYDKHWEEEICPFLPEDFDERYHQCAPEDQQIVYPKGGEDVILRNMMAGRPDVRFKLPRLDELQVRILRTDYSTDMLVPVVDTLFFETEKGSFSAVWRTSVPIRRRIQEFSALAVGPVDPAWWERKKTGADGCHGCAGETDENEGIA
ncbi:hypothetical protein CR152_16855 [Massilia violaceinigra]|uniref:DUF2169 domain-containing protein n=1 Tax=Massilia violaceinigra TaxID=2045208 RepID=A0A2D2DM29_9BURK|nr:DUF2169 domain-containing protein [Massilia violaceinigra]ATQ76020.1 hypothetical protein CR152_16855 [Massilia violaceinigra]